MPNSERLLKVLGPAFGSLEPLVDEATIGRVSAALAPLIDDEEFVCAMVSPHFVQEFRGADAVRDAWADWLEPYSELHFRVEEARDVGENVLLNATQVGITRHDGVSVEQPSGSVWKFRGERLHRVEFHLDRRAAERSAGEG